MKEEQILEIISETLSIDIRKISLDSHLENDLSVDSLDIIDLTLAFESELDEDIPDSIIPQIKTVRDIVNYIQSRC